MMIGFDGDRLAIAVDRFLCLTKVGEDQPSIVPTVVVVGIEVEGAIVGRESFWIPLKFEQRFALKVPDSCDGDANFQSLLIAK